MALPQSNGIDCPWNSSPKFTSFKQWLKTHCFFHACSGSLRGEWASPAPRFNNKVLLLDSVIRSCSSILGNCICKVLPSIIIFQSYILIFVCSAITWSVPQSASFSSWRFNRRSMCQLQMLHVWSLCSFSMGKTYWTVINCDEFAELI